MFEGADKTADARSGPDSGASERRRSGLSGAVDWQLAARTGAALVPAGPRTSRYSAERVVAELADASIRAEGPVREVSGLLDDQPVPAARIVDRPGWIAAAADSMGQLTGTGLDSNTQRGLLVGKPAGVQAGAMLAFLSTAILGQYDPFTGPDGTLLLVAPNIMAVERALGVSPSDFRFWVCLHEVTHRVQFSSAPWLAEYMRANVDTLGAVGDEPLAEMLSRLLAEVRDRRSGATTDDPSARGVVGLLRATQAPPQRAALDRLLMLGTLLEGHADHVMDAVGPAVVPSVEHIRAAFDKRRKRPTNPLQRLLRALLGVDAKVAQYVRGKAFVDHVVDRVGMAEFNTVWTDADTLPRLDEIDDPQRWITRVLG
ncbi:zinc-dependent metalloprotease [Nocardia sp. NBC_01009]|uniref:zinc-dependent metalloprotease n=1 Tax=Nocardia sp. NBC_01009 TaxID=2975996 RepID=UPI00386D3ADF|nr:zinc-dependent metalloprotease [Nocardia sp. NBC_01009]